MVQTEIRWRIKRSCTETERRRASPQRRRGRVWLTWPSLKNTTPTCAGRPGVLCWAPSQHHQRRPVTESFSLPINPPGAAGTARCWFRFTSPPPICASLVAVLAARRERSGDFCRALLEAAERGGHTRDHRKNAPVGAPEVPQVVLLRACA